MALRSLGSSLVAKSTPGSATRDLLEKQISKPAIPGKGEIGTTNRDLATETGVTPAAPGSEKVIAAGPGVEGSQVISPTEVAPTQAMQPLLAGGMGLPQGPGQMGSNNMAMMDGSASRVAASAPSTGGRTASARSGGPVAGTTTASGSILPSGASSSFQAPAPVVAPQIESFTSRLLGGSKSYADEPGKPSAPQTQYSTAQRNVSQGAAQTAATILSGNKANMSYGGGAVNAQNPTAMSLARYANNPTVTGSGIGSITDVASQLRSMASTAKDKATTWLRSLFGKR